MGSAGPADNQPWIPLCYGHQSKPKLRTIQKYWKKKFPTYLLGFVGDWSTRRPGHLVA